MGYSSLFKCLQRVSLSLSNGSANFEQIVSSKSVFVRYFHITMATFDLMDVSSSTPSTLEWTFD
jgi:hypothetical protein